MNKDEPQLHHYSFSSESPVYFNVHRHRLIPEPIFDIHLAPEIGVVLGGRMARYFGDVRVEYSRGGVWIAGMLEPHGRQALEPDSLTAVFMPSPDFFANTSIPGVAAHLWQEPLNTPARNRPLIQDEELARMAERLQDALQSIQSAALKSAEISLGLLQVLLRINRLGGFKTSKFDLAADFRRLQPALALVFNSFQPVNTAEAALRCKLSVSRFSQLFEQATGQSFSKFSLRHRLSRVALELKQSGSSLDELAEKWGFANKSHLLHRFKEHYNVTPAAFRGR